VHSTLPPDDILSTTTTTTVPYTDVIVTISTTESTSYATSTSYAEVVETVTAYSSTRITTVTEVVTAPTPGPEPTMKKRSPKKRGCNKTTSSLSTASTPDASASSLVPDATSSTAEPTVTSSTSALYPVASNCASLEEYSSACSCINAVSSTATLTMSLPGFTDVVTVTESSAIPTTSTSVVTVVVSSTITVPATTTITATTTGLFETTTTVTTTTTPVPPTQTAYLQLQGGPRTGKYLAVVAQYVQWSSTATTGTDLIKLITAGGQPSLAADNSKKLFLHSASSKVGVLYFETDAQAGSFGDQAVNCKIDGDLVTCVSPVNGLNKLLQCGAYVYLASQDFTQASCNALTGLKMSFV